MDKIRARKYGRIGILYADVIFLYPISYCKAASVAQGTGMNKGSSVKIRHRRATVMYEKALPEYHCRKARRWQSVLSQETY